MLPRAVKERVKRVSAAIFAVLHLLLAPALSVTDAAAQARSAFPSAVHVEDHSQAECRAPHDDRCVVCKQLQSAAAAAPSCVLPPVVLSAPTVAAAAASTNARSDRHQLPLSRAPPASR